MNSRQEAAKKRWAERKAREAAASAVAEREEDPMQEETVPVVDEEPVKVPANNPIIVYDDEDDSQMTYQAMAQDQWRGAIVDPKFHHCIVTEHDATKGLPSNVLKYRQMGYTIAPAPIEIRKRWDEAKSWVFRIPVEVRQKNVEKARELARQQRGEAAHTDGDIELVKNERGKVSYAELMDANG